MDATVDSGPAGIDPDLAGLSRDELSHLAGARVVEADCAQSAATLAPGDASALSDG